MNVLFSVLFYLAAGRFWWRRIVVPGPVEATPEAWRSDLAEADGRGDVAVLAVKAIFVLIWPLVLVMGLLVRFR